MLDKITGVIKIWVYEGEYGVQYSTTISKKDKNGEYENCFIKVQFSNAVDTDKLTNGCDFKVTDSWLSFYTKKTGEQVMYLFVNKGDIITDGKQDKSKQHTKYYRR